MAKIAVNSDSSGRVSFSSGSPARRKSGNAAVFAGYTVAREPPEWMKDDRRSTSAEIAVGARTTTPGSDSDLSASLGDLFRRSLRKDAVHRLQHPLGAKVLGTLVTVSKKLPAAVHQNEIRNSFASVFPDPFLAASLFKINCGPRHVHLAHVGFHSERRFVGADENQLELRMFGDSIIIIVHQPRSEFPAGSAPVRREIDEEVLFRLEGRIVVMTDAAVTPLNQITFKLLIDRLTVDRFAQGVSSVLLRQVRLMQSIKFTGFFGRGGTTLRFGFLLLLCLCQFRRRNSVTAALECHQQFGG